MDIFTLNLTTYACPQAIYDAVQHAMREGTVEMAYHRAPAYTDPGMPIEAGPIIYTLVTLWWPTEPKKGDRWMPGKMLRWWVPAVGGGTRIVGYGPGR